MIAIPGKVYKRRDRTSRFTDIRVVCLAHDFYKESGKIVAYQFADTDPENGLCYHMPLYVFENEFTEDNHG